MPIVAVARRVPARTARRKYASSKQRDAVELQPERVRAEAMTAEAIGVDVELELLDPILRRAAVVVPAR